MAKRFSISKSNRFLKASDELLVRGCQGHKRNHDMAAIGYPTFTQRAKGAYFWDVDGHRYLDYLLGFGPILLGYNDPAVNAAVRRQIEEGTIYTTAHPKEIALSRTIVKLMPCAEKVAMFLGGSAATSGCLRLARTYTKRDMVMRCGYHGWNDWAQPGGAGVPGAIGELTVAVPYNDLDAAEAMFRKHPGKIAVWILETIQGEGPREGYLQGAIDLCHRYGALAAFDEIKVGFRVALGGAQELYGLTPDLATFGKACYNGYPGSFVCGRKEILDQCNDAWLAATFHCDMLSMVALETVISEMKRRSGIRHQWRMGERLMKGVNATFEEAGLPFRLVGTGPMPTPKNLGEEKETQLRILRYCLEKGFYLHPWHPWFLSLSHTRKNIDDTVGVVQEAVRKVTRPGNGR